MEYKNLVYIGFLNIPQEKIILSYPDPEPEIYSNIIDQVKDKVFDSFKNCDTGIIDINIEGVSLFFLADDKKITGAFLVTLGEDYPRRFANSLLNDFVKLVISGGYNSKNTPVGFKFQLMPELSQLFHKYDSIVESDPTRMVMIKVNNAKENINSTIENVLDSLGNVEVLRNTSEKLKDKSIFMYKQSTKLKNFHLNKRIAIISISVGLSVVAIIIIALIIYFTIK